MTSHRLTRMKHGFCILVALGLGACATPQLAPRFDAPSTVPIEQAHKQIKADLESARKHTAQIKDKCPQAEALVTALSSDLDGANSALQTSEGARLQLKTQLQDQTTKANKLAGDYDKLSAENTKNKTIVKKVNAYWGLGAFGYGFVVLVKHLLILAAVLAALAVAIIILSFFFPFILPALQSAGAIIATVFTRISSRFRKK